MGVVLRVLWPGGFLFRQDEAEHLVDSLAVSQQGERPVHAWPSSAGLPNGPGYLYFLAAITRFTTDPSAAQATLTLLNLLALAVSVPLFRRWFRAPRDADIAVALYATSPVAIWFSRKIWDPCLLPPLAVPALWLATHALTTRRSRAAALLLPLLAVLVQVHQSAVFFAILLVAVAAPALWRGSRAASLAGLGLAAILILPYARFVLASAVSGGLVARTRSVWPDIDVVTNLLLDATGHNILQTAGFASGGLLRWPVPPVGLLVQLAMVPFAITFALGYAELIRPRTGTLEPAVRRLLIALAVLLPALFLLARVQGAAHYYLTVWPALFALMVLGARRAATSRSWIRRLPPLGALAVLGATSWLLFQSYMSQHHGSVSYGLPYASAMQAAREVADAADVCGRGTADAPLRLAVDIPKDRGPLPHQYRYLLERRLGVVVRAPEPGTPPDLVLRVSWGDNRPHPLGPDPVGAWEVLAGS